MTVQQVQTGAQGRELAVALQREGRKRPAVVVTTAAGAAEPYVDVDELDSAVGDLCDIHVMPTGPVSWAFSRALPEGRQVYGGASRVYSVDLGWMEEMRRSPLRFAYGRRDRVRVTEELISDAIAAAAAAGLGRAAPAATTRLATGAVRGVAGGRGLVDVGGTWPATVWPELIAEGVPVERLFVPGMRAEGVLDTEANRLDVSAMVLTPQAALSGFGEGARLLGRAVRVTKDSADIALIPAYEIAVSPSEATGDATTDLREVLSVDEVVAVEVSEVGEARPTKLRLVNDVDLHELTAATVLEGGPPWLVPPSAVADVPDASVASEATEEASRLATEPALDAQEAPELAGLRVENANLRADLERSRSKSARLERALAEQRTAMRQARAAAQVAARQRDEALDGRVPTDQLLFTTRAESFRFNVYAAWATRTTAADKAEYPWREFVVGADFFATWDAVEGMDAGKVAEVVAEVVCGRADRMHALQMHQLRVGRGPEEPVVQRGAGETCWRVSLQRNTPSARRLHFWRRLDGSVELASIRVHDDIRV